MHHEKVEYIRFDDLKTGILINDKPYLISRGSLNSFLKVNTPLSQIELLDQIGERLRYKDKFSPSEKWEAITEFSEQLRPFFIDLKTVPDDTGHIEIYLNPSELALIPFELLLDESGSPFFIHSDERKFVLTRNFRRDEISKDIGIPEIPRVLFAHAKPAHDNYLGLPFADVPSQEHLQVLEYALRHWDLEQQLTHLDNPTFEQFKNEINKASEEGNPFTHIHILAHGSLLFDHNKPSDFEYGIAFNLDDQNEKYRPVTTQQIKELFENLSPDNKPYLVNYMICDGANFTNGIKANRNPVQATFLAGVPVVIGSQFPLTQDGSVRVTKELYEQLFRGEDLRMLLGKIRTKLFKDQEKYGHDWLSLVTYLNLPDNYELQLLSHKTKRQLAILNSIRDKDELDLQELDDFLLVISQIELSIKDLSQEAGKLENQNARIDEFLEYAGLLGSANKRLAQIINEADGKNIETKMSQFDALKESMKWYRSAALKNLSHHWSIVQYLSLKTITDGQLNDDDLDYWYAARAAAKDDISKNPAKATWPYGTLLELCLLAPEGTDDNNRNKCMEYAALLSDHAKELDKPEHSKSTYLQVNRYRSWWDGPEFKVPDTILAADKLFLDEVLKILNYE